MNEPLLSVRDLVVEFKTELGVVRALNGVSFDLPRNCITAIVGESGSGKSVTANSIMRLLPDSAKTAGTVTLHPQDDEAIQVSSLDKRDPKLQSLRGGLVSMVFQEPIQHYPRCTVLASRWQRLCRVIGTSVVKKRWPKLLACCRGLASWMPKIECKCTRLNFLVACGSGSLLPWH